MNPSAETPKDCLVLGAGALGLLLAQALCETDWPGLGRPKVLLHNRTPVPSEVDFVFENGIQQSIKLTSSTGRPEDVLQVIQPRVVFLCLPPEQTETVFKRWLSAFEAAQMPYAHPVQFVFCNNGCLTQSLMQYAGRPNAKYSFLRALFFVGAMREKSVNGWEIRWTGGKKVIWNSLTDEEEQKKDSKDSPLLFMPSKMSFLEWSKIPDVRAAERQKFFTNFILAAGIGPQLAKNKTLPETLPDSIVVELAKQFEILWGSRNVSAAKLQSTLSETIAATGENINSLSYAAAHGNSATMNWFLESLKQEIDALGKEKDLHHLQKFIDSVGAVWRKTQ